MTIDARWHAVAPHPLDRSVAEVAGAIIEDHRWHERPIPPAAEPHLHAMLGIGSSDLRDRHGHERVADVVRRALAGLAGWQGPVASEVERELRAALAAAGDADGVPPAAPGVRPPPVLRP